MNEIINRIIINLFPGKLISSFIGFLSKLERPKGLLILFIKFYSHVYKVNLDESKKEISEFNSFAEFFNRDLKENIREVEDEVVSPVDGTLREFSKVSSNLLPNVKGKFYPISDLSEDSEDIFKDSNYFNFYLSPADYHNVHAPLSGKIYKSTYIPGSLLPVNDFSFNRFPNLFTLNERLIISIKTEYGLVLLVMIGALNVGKIITNYDQELNQKIKTNKYKKFTINHQEPINIKIADKIASFALGSSVILLFEKNIFNLDMQVKKPHLHLKYGKSLKAII